MNDVNGVRPLALVTGASRGIGASTAKALAADGVHVVAVDIEPEGLAATAADIRSRGGQIDTDIMDVRSSASVDAAVKSAEDRHGHGFDLLVNNAGFASVALLEDIDDDHWEEVIRLNLSSMMRVSRAVVPGMRKQGGGSVICLSSIAGTTAGWPGRLAYSSAKAGVAGFVKTLAMELAPHGIRVNGVSPAGLHASVEQVPLGRVGSPDDIGDFIAMLASSRASFMTGQVISVDGGMSVTL